MINLKQEKERLRQTFRELRRAFAKKEKEQYDREILKKLTSLYQYRNASLLLTYVSKEIEVDTLRLIRKALGDGKQVAVPKCIDGTRNMEFYTITGVEQLEKSTFGVLEPITGLCPRTEITPDALCIVPGMAFDAEGYRLGYGKGYYDRFLSGFGGVTAGLCYSGCFRWRLPHGRYDRPVAFIVTERFFRKTDRTQRSHRN